MSLKSKTSNLPKRVRLRVRHIGPWMACKIGEAGHSCQAVKSPCLDHQIDRLIIGQVRIGNYENHRSALLSQHRALDQITRAICRSACQILEPRMDSEG